MHRIASRIYNRLPLVNRTPRLDTAERIAGHCRSMVRLGSDSFILVILGADYRLITTIDLAEHGGELLEEDVFHIAAQHKAANVAIVYGEASGSLEFSQQDFDEIFGLAELGEAVGIVVMGCIAFGSGSGRSDRLNDRDWLAIGFKTEPSTKEKI